MSIMVRRDGDLPLSITINDSNGAVTGATVTVEVRDDTTDDSYIDFDDHQFQDDGLWVTKTISLPEIEAGLYATTPYDLSQLTNLPADTYVLALEYQITIGSDLFTPVEKVTISDIISTSAASATLIKDAVWNATASDYTTAGSTGYAIRGAHHSGITYQDSNAGVSGTAYPVGTAERPALSLSSAITIGSAHSKVISVSGTGQNAFATGDVATLSAGHWLFFGAGKGARPAVSGLTPSQPHALGASSFLSIELDATRLELGPAGTGLANFQSCRVLDPALVQNAVMVDCELDGTWADVTATTFVDCYGTVAMTDTDYDSSVEFVRFGGILTLTNFSTGTLIVGLNGGTLNVDASNTGAASITVLGIGNVTGAEAGTVDTSGMVVMDVDAQAVRDSAKLAPTAGAFAAGSLDAKVSRLYGGNTRTKQFRAVGAIAGRNVAAGAVSHLEIDHRDAESGTWPGTVYYVVFRYVSGATATDAPDTSTIESSAPVDGTFTSAAYS